MPEQSLAAKLNVAPCPTKVNLYVTWRKNDNSPVLKNNLQQVTHAAGKYLKAASLPG